MEKLNTNSKIQHYKKQYRIFLILGVLGAINIVTQSYIKSSFGVNLGAFGFVLLFSVGRILGSAIGSLVAVTIQYVFNLALIYFIISFIYHKKMSKAQQLSNKE